MRATLQVYREFGDFDMKAVNRFRVLVHELGPDKVTEELRARVPNLPGAGESLWTGEFNDHLGVHADTHGTHYVGLCIPMGRLTDDEWVEVARLARTHGDGGVRMSQRQNLLLTGVHDVDALLAEPTSCRPTSPRPTRSSGRSSRAPARRSASSRSTT